MITTRLSTYNLLEQPVEGLAFFVNSTTPLEHQLNNAQKFYPALLNELQRRKFTGKANSSVFFTGNDGTDVKYIIIAGLGDNKTAFEFYRRALGSIVRIAERQRLVSLALTLPDASFFNVSQEYLFQESYVTLSMADYHFDDYITNPDKKAAPLECIVSIPESLHEQAREGFERGEIIAHAVRTARRWCDLPPSQLTPPELAADARVIGDKYDLNVKIYDEAAIAKMGMGGIEGVSRGSDNDGRFVTMEYKPTTSSNQTVVLVGKGVTFDSGGLSLKPARSMETMKDDMAGAAVVIATMEALARLKPNINVIACVPIVENLPSGKAQKPGDIITFYNGKTAEVKDTDAEGRLILADALSYAVKQYKPDAIIDLATLTGACPVALGPFFAALLSNNDSVAHALEKAAKVSGDRVWRMPLDDDFRASITSDIADLCNIGKPAYMAGTITAALFLESFIGATPWAHLDIAGTAFNVPDISYFRPGATGFGVRLLTELIMNWPANK